MVVIIAQLPPCSTSVVNNYKNVAPPTIMKETSMTISNCHHTIDKIFKFLWDIMLTQKNQYAAGEIRGRKTICLRTKPE
jgi:hypothetical protein